MEWKEMLKARITINGKNIPVGDGNNITVAGGKITINGKEVGKDIEGAKVMSSKESPLPSDFMSNFKTKPSGKDYTETITDGQGNSLQRDESGNVISTGDVNVTRTYGRRKKNE